VIPSLAAVLTLALLCALVHRRVLERRRREAYELALERLRLDLHRVAVEIGRQLLPAMQRMCAAIVELSKSLEVEE